MSTTLLARTFGHLTGATRTAEANAIARAVAAKAAKSETPEEKAKREAEEEEAARSAAAAAAENEDGDECNCEEDDDDCDCDDEEMNKADDDAKAAAAARQRERARCAAIFASPFAKGREGVAANIAFNTNLTRKEARALLASMGPVPAAKPANIRDAMALVHPPRPNAGGATPPANSEKAIEASWERAFGLAK
jgi:hypothetical protein